MQLDQARSYALGDEAEAHMDLRKPGQPGEQLMPHLANRYEEMTRAALAGHHGDVAAMERALDVLIRQLSVAQADLFALKSLVLGRDEMALTRDWDYCDPMEAHAALLGRSTVELRREQGAQYVIPTPASIIGYGWHSVEEKDDLSWCWSGPGRESLLLLPRLFTGAVEITLEITLLTRAVLPETGNLEVDGRNCAYQLQFDDDESTQAMLRVTADLNESETANFALKLSLSETLSPRDLWGKQDGRQLGICLKRLIVRAL